MKILTNTLKRNSVALDKIIDYFYWEYDDEKGFGYKKSDGPLSISTKLPTMFGEFNRTNGRYFRQFFCQKRVNYYNITKEEYERGVKWIKSKLL